MPAAVNAYRKTLSIEDARVEQREIDETYTADMTDPENGISGVAARKVWRSIPSQLLRSSTKKFKYSEVERGRRRAKLIEPLDWLEGAGIISVNSLTEGIEAPSSPSTTKTEVSLRSIFSIRASCSINSVLTRGSGSTSKKIPPWRCLPTFEAP